MAVSEALAPAWSRIILDELQELTDADEAPSGAEWVVVHTPAEGRPYIVDGGATATETGAIVVAEDFAAAAGGGEVTKVRVADLFTAAAAIVEIDPDGGDANTLADKIDAAIASQIVSDGDPDTGAADAFDELALEAELDAELAGEDPDAGRLFDVPRVAVALDESDPSILKLAFSGSIELDRSVASDVDLYNRIKAGRDAELHVTAHVVGARTVHRRDADGNVDAVVQTKSLKVHSLDDPAGEL